MGGGGRDRGNEVVAHFGLGTDYFELGSRVTPAVSRVWCAFGFLRLALLYRWGNISAFSIDPIEKRNTNK